MHYIRLRIIVFISLCLLVASCKQIEYITQAQDAFNKAAEIEYSNILTITKFNNKNSDLERINLNQGNYAIAYNRVNKAISSGRSKLEKDGLLGTALTLKALCEWKLGKFTDADATAREALIYIEDQQRDKAVMDALPGLIKADQAFLILNSTSNINADYPQIKESIIGALEDFENASVGLNGHPVTVYLQIAALSSISTLSRAATLMSGSDAVAEREDIRNKYSIPYLEELKSLTDPQSQVYKNFQYLLGQ